MAILASELKYFKSAHSATDSNNTLGNEIESLGGSITESELQSGALHDLFDAVTSAEAVSGRDEYRCIYLKNTNNTQTLYDAKVYIQSNTPSIDSAIEIALDPADVGVDSNILLADEVDTSALTSGLVFSSAPDSANALSIGDIAAGEYKAIWIKRLISPNAQAALDGCTLAFRGDTDA